MAGVTFRGEPGIGRSRLAAAAVELAEGSGAVVLELIGSPFHTDAGLHPVRTLLERRCGIDRMTDPADRLRLLQAEVGHDYRARRVARLRGRLYEAHRHVDGLHRRFPETRHSLPADAPGPASGGVEIISPGSAVGRRERTLVRRSLR